MACVMIIGRGLAVSSLMFIIHIFYYFMYTGLDVFGIVIFM